jgi:hypothetical protein
VPAPDAGFSVTFASPKFQPVTVPVRVIRNPGDFASPPTTIIQPSPVFAELQPAAPPPKGRKPMRPEEAEATHRGRSAGACPGAARLALNPGGPCRTSPASLLIVGALQRA